MRIAATYTCPDCGKVVPTTAQLDAIRIHNHEFAVKMAFDHDGREYRHVRVRRLIPGGGDYAICGTPEFQYDPTTEVVRSERVEPTDD